MDKFVNHPLKLENSESCILYINYFKCSWNIGIYRHWPWYIYIVISDIITMDDFLGKQSEFKMWLSEEVIISRSVIDQSFHPFCM